MIGFRKLGPVFTYDMLALSRRWQVYASRAGFVLFLLIGLAIAWMSDNWSFGGYSASPTIADLAEMGEGFFYSLASIQLTFLLLAAPASAAGSICIDRARGTLLHMMVTDLSDAEIVLGRLAARLAPVFGLVACGLPVVALAGLLGGIDFDALLGLLVISLAVGVLGCSLALAISVKASKTHEVLMAVYLIFGAWLLALPIWWILTQGGSKIPNPPQWFENLNPYSLVFAPYVSPTTFRVADLAIFCGSVLTIAAGLVGWSILNLRRAVIATSGEPKKRKPRFGWIKKYWPSMPGPTLDGNPVLWREWHRNRPSRMARSLWSGLYFVTWSMALWGVIAILIGFNGIVHDIVFELALMLQLFFGFLMVAATSPTVLAEERTRGSLDILLSTPLSTRSIVFAKWWGAYRMIFNLAILPTFAAIFLAATAPDVPSYAGSLGANYKSVPLTPIDRLISPVITMADFLASGAVIVSIGVLLATWISRVGRAVGASVVVYVLSSVGWVFLVETLLEEFVNIGEPLKEAIEALSPAFGPIFSIVKLTGLTNEPRILSWTFLAIVVLLKLIAAGSLLGLTIATFNRRLGRVIESRPADYQRPIGPPTRSKRKAVRQVRGKEPRSSPPILALRIEKNGWDSRR